MIHNYQTITNVLEQFAANHLAVARFECSFDDQLDQFATVDASWPILYAVPQDVTFVEDTNQYRFKIYSLTLVQGDRSDEKPALTHTHLILADLVNWLKYNLADDLVLINEPQIRPINYISTEGLMGWVGDFIIESEAEANDCSIPFDNNFGFTGRTCSYNNVLPFLTCDALQYCPTIMEMNTSINYLLARPDIYISGGTFSDGTIVLTNTTGGTVSITCITSGSGDSYWISGSTGLRSLKPLGNNGDAQGDNSLIIGYGNVTQGENSLAIGQYTFTQGSNSLATGFGNSALGGNSFVGGNDSQAIGGDSIAFGDSTIAEGYASAAIGSGSYTLGDNSIATGQNTQALGDTSTAMGNSTTASGDNSFASNRVTTASGPSSVAMGDISVASGYGSFAMGGDSGRVNDLYTTASGRGAFAIGYGSLAQGDFAFAGGGDPDTGDGIAGGQATGKNSFAFGAGSQAVGDNTFALGYGINAVSANTTYVDQLNVMNPLSNPAVSNLGIDNNGFVVLTSGSTSTDVYVTGGTYTAGTAIFTNNTGGTFSVSGFSTSTSSVDILQIQVFS